MRRYSISVGNALAATAILIAAYVKVSIRANVTALIASVTFAAIAAVAVTKTVAASAMAPTAAAVASAPTAASATAMSESGRRNRKQ
jgi:hypothetical protein